MDKSKVKEILCQVMAMKHVSMTQLKTENVLDSLSAAVASASDIELEAALEEKESEVTARFAEQVLLASIVKKRGGTVDTGSTITGSAADYGEVVTLILTGVDVFAGTDLSGSSGGPTNIVITSVGRSLPNLPSGYFQYLYGETGFGIYVPDELVDIFKVTQGWSAYADYIHSLSDYLENT